MQCLLHVDDEVATRQAVRQRLAPFYDVVCAESRCEGREMLQQNPDLCELLRSVRLLIAASWSHHRHLVGTLSLPHERPRSPLTPSTVPERSGRVQQAMQFIDEHYAEPLPLRRVAATAAMSRFAFSRAFTAVMGVQFRTYLLQLRIAKACPLLVDSSRSISDVAQVVGFTDLPRFDKVFKKQTGLSPSQYRWRHQPGATNDKK